MYAPSGAAAKVLTNPAKKLNHEVWKARMCGLANEKTLMAVALCSASTCARGTEEERHTNTEAAAQNEFIENYCKTSKIIANYRRKKKRQSWSVVLVSTVVSMCTTVWQ